MKNRRNVRVIHSYVPNGYFAMSTEISDILCSKEDPATTDFDMGLIKWNYDREAFERTEESMEWRKMLNYDMLKIVAQWDREWCESLQAMFKYIGENCRLVRR